MMVKARAGQGGPALARYLMEGKNEHAEFLELRNMDAPSLKAALFDMDMLARGGHCQKHALHVQMRAAPGERLSASHWLEACDRYAEAFGMEQHQAAVILHHQLDGATHAHFVFNRVHPVTLKAADLWRNYEKHKELARQMEQDWGLQQVSSRKRDRARDYSQAGRGEMEQARRTGENVHDIREYVRWLWEQSPNGEAFALALEEEGYQLAKGDRRAYVVLDPHGSPYSLGSRTTGAKAREVREKLGDLDPAHVPDIEQARRFTEAAKLERGEAVKAFNTQQRHDLTNLLYKEQAEALAAELQRQQEKRERWDKPAQRREPRPRTYPPRDFKAWLSGLFTAKAAKTAPTPQPARPLADAEPPAPKTPEESLLESLRKQEQERQEAKRQHKGRGRSPMGDLLDAHFRKGPR